MSTETEFEGRTALITGSTGGIGSEIARQFAVRGANVMLTGRDVAKGEALALAVSNECGADVDFAKADVGDDDAMRRLVDATVDAFGSIDILVNNAGPMGASLAADFFGATAFDFDTIMKVGAGGAYYGSRHAIPHMLERGFGSVVNISSTAAEAASPGLMAYGMAKAALNQLARSVAIDYGHAGIRCNTIVTGLVMSTPEIRAQLEDPDLAEGFRQVIAGRRFGSPADIAHAVMFLCSDAAAYINGAALAVDGGMTARLAMPIIIEPPAAPGAA